MNDKETIISLLNEFANPKKKYDNKEVYELIHIANCFPALREKKEKNI